MARPKQETLESLTYLLALLAAGVVLLFSVLNRYHFLAIIFRTMAAFFLLYFLGQGLLAIWNNVSPRPVEPVKDKVDVLLDQLKTFTEDGSNKEVQEDTSFSLDIYKKNIPGQINTDLTDKLPDSKQAELAKKMGWQ
ncbi:MAG TPA: hypothetical protein GXX46_11450 [Peptococcaceae bacterium]|nr:hypothetical protein [Peptococcaceae bacterium]